MQTFQTTLENFHTKLWSYHILVPDNIANQYMEGENRRVICTFTGEIRVRSALMASKNGWFVLVNHNIRKQLGAEEGDQLTVKIEKDTSEYGHPMPESFSVLLDQDEAGANLFKGLTMGKQRSLIYIVGKVKNIDSQLNKGLAILDHLKEVKGKLDFKKMNEKIKEYNSRSKPF